VKFPLNDVQCAQIRAAQGHYRRALFLGLAAMGTNFCGGWLLISGDVPLGVGFTLGGLAMIVGAYFHNRIAKRLLGEFYPW
jgi:hypothetical protein